MSRYFYSYLYILLVETILISCENSEKKGYTPHSISGVIWGTAYHITVNGNTEDLMPEINAALMQVDGVANAFEKSSEISRLNSDGYIKGPSSLIQQLLTTSLRINKLTNGAFEPTIGPLVDLWGFGSSKNENAAVSDSIVRHTLQSVGLEKVMLNDTCLYFAKKGMKLDFGAIAKGCGVDFVAIALLKSGIKDFMVEIGGEVRVAGVNPRGNSWAIQLDEPVLDSLGQHRQLGVLQLSDASVATSGNYRNYRYDDKGNLIYHTISPITGYPVKTDILSATIVAADCMTADAYATATVVMGLQKARALIDRLVEDKKSGIYGAIFVTNATANQVFSVHLCGLDADHVTYSNCQ